MLGIHLIAPHQIKQFAIEIAPRCFSSSLPVVHVDAEESTSEDEKYVSVTMAEMAIDTIVQYYNSYRT